MQVYYILEHQNAKAPIKQQPPESAELFYAPVT